EARRPAAVRRPPRLTRRDLPGPYVLHEEVGGPDGARDGRAHAIAERPELVERVDEDGRQAGGAERAHGRRRARRERDARDRAERRRASLRRERGRGGRRLGAPRPARDGEAGAEGDERGGRIARTQREGWV